MKTLHFEIAINAPKQRVWDIMLDGDTYRQWTSPFMEGGYFEGDWQEGSKMHFLGPEGSGMVSVIAQSRPPEFISIKHIGIINKGVEDTESDEASKRAPAFENYTLSETDGVTTVKIEQDIAEEYEAMFNDTWPKALAELKQLAEA